MENSASRSAPTNDEGIQVVQIENIPMNHDSKLKICSQPVSYYRVTYCTNHVGYALTLTTTTPHVPIAKDIFMSRTNK